MEKERLQELKDKAWQTKTQTEWDDVMQEIKQAVEGDNYAATALRKYCKQILPKKREWFEKAANRPQFTAKPKMLFSEDTDKAIGELAKILTEFIKKKM